jgi:hypothetical protein
MASICIDLITPPSSPRENDPPQRQASAASGKRKADDMCLSDDSDVAPPAPAVNNNASFAGASSWMAPSAADDAGGDADLEFVGRSGDLALSDFPHSRHNCLNISFATGAEHKFCDHCYCSCRADRIQDAWLLCGWLTCCGFDALQVTFVTRPRRPVRSGPCTARLCPMSCPEAPVTGRSSVTPPAVSATEWRQRRSSQPPLHRL